MSLLFCGCESPKIAHGRISLRNMNEPLFASGLEVRDKKWHTGEVAEVTIMGSCVPMSSSLGLRRATKRVLIWIPAGFPFPILCVLFVLQVVLQWQGVNAIAVHQGGTHNEPLCLSGV